MGLVNYTRYCSHGWEDRFKEPFDRAFPSVPFECNASAGFKNGIYDHVCYMRKHNLAIDYLGDDKELKSYQIEAKISED